MVLPVRLPNWIHSFITIANHFLGVSGKGEPQNYPGSWSLSGKAIVLAAPINASKFNSFYKHYTYYSYYSSTHLANIFYNHDCNHPIISNHFQFHSVFRSPFLSFHNCPPQNRQAKDVAFPEPEWLPQLAQLVTAQILPRIERLEQMGRALPVPGELEKDMV